MSDKRLIDANALEASFEKNCSGECDNCEHYRIHHASFTKWEMHCGLIRNAHTIDAVEVVHAKWVWTQRGWCCSACCKPSLIEAVAFAKWCPRCGAKMDAKEG